MGKSFKSIKELLREQRIRNSFNTIKTSVYQEVTPVLEMSETNPETLELDLSPIDYNC